MATSYFTRSWTPSSAQRIWGIPSVRAIVGDAGLFVLPRRVRPLAAALRLMTDAWLRRRLAKAARVMNLTEAEVVDLVRDGYLETKIEADRLYVVPAIVSGGRMVGQREA